jgi:hydroxyacylglutathione hydrolase
MAGELDVRWIHGAAPGGAGIDPPFQVHAFDADTYILRQSKELSFEAPFLYLLFGSERALLLDTGADPGAGRSLPLREVVQGIVDRRRAERGQAAIELVVAHTHNHDDHVFGDGQLAGRRGITLVSAELEAVRGFFGLADWPEGEARFDLGGRPLTVVPTPGHEVAHVSFYDPRTRILVSGDILYPGFLYVRDWRAFRRSLERLVRLAERVPVRYLLGAHIEMTATPGIAYPSGTLYQPEEHVLQLEPRHLRQLVAALEETGDRPHRIVLPDLIVEPVETPAPEPASQS